MNMPNECAGSERSWTPRALARFSVLAYFLVGGCAVGPLFSRAGGSARGALYGQYLGQRRRNDGRYDK
jgi:hypothetical protein